MGVKFVTGINFVTEECCNCGISFAMSADFKQRRLNDHGTFYCPAGHPQYYIGKSEAERLRDQLDAQRRRAQMAENQAERERHRTRAQKAAKTRLKNRIANGVCPCCNRTFKNLMQHMQNQHPEFTQSEKPADVQDLIAALLHDNKVTTAPEIVRKIKADHQKALQVLYRMENQGKIERAGKIGRAIKWKAV